uniref:Uncharacterized protein n=1 Tax=Oryza meridionalis TaxID=40149 RepID=A0A0E0DA04_9ORYZ
MDPSLAAHDHAAFITTGSIAPRPTDRTRRHQIREDRGHCHHQSSPHTPRRNSPACDPVIVVDQRTRGCRIHATRAPELSRRCPATPLPSLPRAMPSLIQGALAAKLASPEHRRHRIRSSPPICRWRSHNRLHELSVGREEERGTSMGKGEVSPVTAPTPPLCYRRSGHHLREAPSLDPPPLGREEEKGMTVDVG